MLAASVLDWLSTGLALILRSSATVEPDFTKVGLLGHSRGGKVAFGIALGIAETKQEISSIAVLDPVDGKEDYKSSPPPILTNQTNSFNLTFPTLVVGTGLGSAKKFNFWPKCVPLGMGHSEYFRDSSAPSYHFVAKKCGHMDMLQDTIWPTSGSGVAANACVNGEKREPCRSFMAGITVAFFNSSLLGDNVNLQDAIDNFNTHVNTEIENPEVLSKVGFVDLVEMT